MQGFGLSQRPISKVVKQLMLVSIGLFVLEVFLDPVARHPEVVGPLARRFGLSWGDIRHGMVWQLVTYMFLHGSVMHLFMNMFGLFMLGPELEDALGSRRFLKLFVGCGVFGGLGWLLLSGASGATCVGASGAVFGIIGAFAALFPNRKLTFLLFFVLPVTASARTLAIVFGVISLMMLRVGGGGVAHAAHLAGGVAGYLYGQRLAGLAGYGQTASGWSLSSLKAWYRRRRYTVVSGDETPVNWAEVDQVLDKVGRHGINSLSGPEKELLDRASKTARH
ncbi:MAG: rhomboid family intramembrane serine protease [Verrucomicrobia bacterium]|jgi:membrane associated rhomboid family serine protease|nr:rhomboid family intramembrane serine protease [Verrucomicrobiota bacterium]